VPLEFLDLAAERFQLPGHLVAVQPFQFRQVAQHGECCPFVALVDRSGVQRLPPGQVQSHPFFAMRPVVTRQHLFGAGGQSP